MRGHNKTIVLECKSVPVASLAGFMISPLSQSVRCRDVANLRVRNRSGSVVDVYAVSVDLSVFRR